MPDILRSELERRIGYTFHTPELLLNALTHSSFAHEQKAGRIQSNERLEFLGDAVLSIIVSRYLYHTYPHLSEGRLTVIRKSLINKDVLPTYGRRIGLGEFLLLGRGEEKEGRDKPKILEDAFEALLGAMYLDCGDLDRVADFLLPFVCDELRHLEETLSSMEDYKTLLQQYVQQTPGEELRYVTVSEEGPDNAKVFTVQALINSNVFGEGQGTSKARAAQAAAREALSRYLPKP